MYVILIIIYDYCYRYCYVSESRRFFKAALVAPGRKQEFRPKSAGRPFEVVHNTHSKRKTPTAATCILPFGSRSSEVSFQEVLRSFGDDAVSSAGKGVEKTPMASC